MKWIRKDLSKWHKWFAWHPVRVGESNVIWLEFVLRSSMDRYPGLISRFFCLPNYNYKESVLDLLKDNDKK